MEIQTHYGHKEINAENAANKDEHHKQEVHPGHVVIFHGAVFRGVERLVQVIRPAFQGGDHKQGDHTVQKIVVVDIVGFPLPIHIVAAATLVFLNKVKEIRTCLQVILFLEFVLYAVAKIQLSEQQIVKQNREHQPIQRNTK